MDLLHFFLLFSRPFALLVSYPLVLSGLSFRAIVIYRHTRRIELIRRIGPGLYPWQGLRLRRGGFFGSGCWSETHDPGCEVGAEGLELFNAVVDAGTVAC